MMILKVIGFVFIALFFYLLFKDKRSDIAMLLVLGAGILVFIFCLSQFKQVVDFINTMAQKAGIDSVYIGIVLKIVAIAYISSFASEICKDAGAGSLSSKVELAGKLFILVLSVPILMAVLNSIISIL